VPPRAPCRAGRADPLGRDHRPQPAPWRGHRVAAPLRSRGDDRCRALRPGADSLRDNGMILCGRAASAGWVSLQ
jgi:hypothetical protein